MILEALPRRTSLDDLLQPGERLDGGDVGRRDQAFLPTKIIQHVVARAVHDVRKRAVRAQVLKVIRHRLNGKEVFLT